jgi:hypothetical protein
LIENLNDLQGDIILIKNIDNIVPDHLKAATYTYTRLLGGYDAKGPAHCDQLWAGAPRNY